MHMYLHEKSVGEATRKLAQIVNGYQSNIVSLINEIDFR